MILRQINVVCNNLSFRRSGFSKYGLVDSSTKPFCHVHEYFSDDKYKVNIYIDKAKQLSRILFNIYKDIPDGMHVAFVFAENKKLNVVFTGKWPTNASNRRKHHWFL